jgi:hypothetical protein
MYTKVLERKKNINMTIFKVIKVKTTIRNEYNPHRERVGQTA